MTPYRTLLLKFYMAYNSRRLDDALAMLHPEVDWAEGRDGSRILGRQNVRAQWIRQWTGMTPHVEPVGFDLDNHGRTVVRVHQYLRDFEGDIIAKGFVEHAFHISDSLITRMDFVAS